MKAPFTQDQVNHITDFQSAGIVHELTCGNCRSILTAQRDGLHCPNCDYTQDWVPDIVADGSFLREQVQVMDALGFK